MAASNNKRRREDDSLLVFDASHFFQNLLADDGEPCFPDLQISCGGKVFEVQRSVLASVSPVLKQLFTRNQQNSPGKPLDLPKEFVTKESFALILDLIYKSEITIDGDNVLRLHSAGNYLEIDQVTNKCSDFIVQGLTIASVISVWDYACKITSTGNRLLKQCLQFMGRNFSNLVKHDTLLALKKGEVCLLLSQLRNVDDENLVLEAVLEWLGHHWKARFKDCEEVLSRVLWQFVDQTRCCGLKAVKVIKSKVDPTSFEEVSMMNTLFSKINGTAEADSLDSSGSISYYLFHEEKDHVTYTFEKLSLAQQGSNSAPVVSRTEQQQIQPVEGYLFRGFFAFQGRLMAVLSHEGDGYFKQGFMLAGISENGDPKMLAQLEVLQIDNSYDSVKITSHGGVLFIFQCCIKSSKPFLLSTHDLRKFGRRFVYDDDELFSIPVLSRTIDAQATGKISLYSILTSATEVYFFGVGKNCDDAVGVDVFHVANQTWTTFPPLQAARLYPTAEVVDRYFYVVGGYEGPRGQSMSRAVEILNIDDPLGWSELPWLKYGRQFCHLISCGPFLIVFGGKDRNNLSVEKAEILDMENLGKGWEEYPPLHSSNPRFVAKA